MTRTWIEPIFDRTYGDVQSAQYNPDQENPKGCWNAIDLNRVEKNTAYCAEWMLEKKIVRTPPEITVRENDYWQVNMIPTKSEIDRIINNVRLLVELSSTNPAIAYQLPTIYAATQINYVLANQIEFALDLMHDQPKLPLEYWKVQITNGIVTTVLRESGVTEIINTQEALVAEDEVVTIRGLEYGVDSQYQTFTYWSGKAEDIELLDSYMAQETTFTMPYREVAFTANFETHIPRTLTLTNAYISINDDPTAESGPTTGTYYAGDQIMIIANVAATGKAFYEWTGTQAGLNNITGTTYTVDPSTSILTMPDCDVSLTPKYINAGQHSVTVTNGNGTGWYDYQQYVSISANVPTHYAFSHWSGDTSYLSDIYSDHQSFRMSDVNISFTANFVYVYSYNSVQIIDGLIRIDGENVSQANNLRQNSSQTLIPTPPNSNQGLDYWSVEGAGYIQTDIYDNHTNTFVVGDGNAIITGHYANLGTLTVINVNNTGDTSTSRIVRNHKVSVNTTEVVGNYIFTNWTENSVIVSNSTYYVFTMPEVGKTLTANYRLRNQVEVTINYGSHSETVIMTERDTKTIIADPAPEGKRFARWDSSGVYDVWNRLATNTYFIAGSGNGTVTAVYEDVYVYHYLTVNGAEGTGSYREGWALDIDANQAPYGYEFEYWEINSGNGTIDNIYSKETKFRMGTTDAEITAHYKIRPTFTVTVINGYIQDHNGDWVTSATLPRDATNLIKMKPAPTGYQFLQWEVLINGVVQTNANDIYQPLAEQTTLRGLSRDFTARATYFQPSVTPLSTLTIERKNGTIEQRQYPVGTDVQIHASYPDQGMEFWKWSGDVAYIAGGIYNANSYVHMPIQNVRIKENFVPEGFIPGYDLDMTNIYGQCCYTTSYTNPDTGEVITTDHWVSRWSYPAGTVVRIRATGYDNEYYFSTWDAKVHRTEDDARSVISNLSLSSTTLTMPEYDIDVEAKIATKETYELRINDGGTSGYYYEGARADVYFNKEDTDDIHYQFLRWTGSTVAQIELYDGGMFNVLTPGNSVTPQYIKMPGENTEITATYKTLYKLALTNGIIDATGESQGFFETDTVVNITANTAPSGMVFQYWAGNTEHIANIYDPTTTITTVAGITNIRAVYSTVEDRNDIGYVNSDLKSTNTITNSLITVVSGTIEIGFIITDINGHVYIITSVDDVNDTSTIYRMTKVTRGGNIYG